jgi:hypothetical protein
VSNPLDQLYSHLHREDGHASTIQVRANPNDFKDSGDDLQYLPNLTEIEESARKAGEYLGKPEGLSDEDQKVLLSIIGAVSQIALNEDQARVQEFKDGKNDNDISMFFTNSLSTAKVFVLEPFMQALKETGNGQRSKHFIDLCKAHALSWKAFSDLLGVDVAERISLRVDGFFDDALKLFSVAGSENSPVE